MFPMTSETGRNDKANTEKNGISKVKSKNLNTSTLKRTNRIVRSCSRCKKRKVKCNFEIPCDRCIARNQAHLCSRDPVIFDGLLVSNDDKQELKYSKENEVLKKKISELQDTIARMKYTNNFFLKKGITEETNPPSATKNSSQYEKKEYLNLDRLMVKPKTLKKKDRSSNLENYQEWKIYSSTICLLKNGLLTGEILDNSDLDIKEISYNTEDWLKLKDRKYQKYSGEDSQAKCWQYQLDLLEMLDKTACDILIKSGLRVVTLLPIIDRDAYWEKYKNYWADDSVKDKHLTTSYSKSSSSYSFLGLMYAIMCVGVYQCENEDIKSLGFKNHDWETYSKGLFGASLECLYRGRYMTHLKFESIQTISLLRLLSDLLGGNILSNNLTCIQYFLCFKLNLAASNEEIRVNNMWILFAYDWYDSNDRYCLSNISSSNTLPRLEKWMDSNHKQINWSNFYLNFLVEISSIKKKYYYSNDVITLDSLIKADIQLRLLKIEAFQNLDDYFSTKEPQISLYDFRHIQIHVISTIHHEILEVNCKISTFVEYQEWSLSCYSICYHSANEIIQNFVSKDYTIPQKSHSLLCQQVVYAVVFLLVDSMLDVNHLKFQRKVGDLIKQVFNIFNSFRSATRCAVRGIYVIERLLQLSKKTRNTPPLEESNVTEILRNKNIQTDTDGFKSVMKSSDENEAMVSTNDDSENISIQGKCTLDDPNGTFKQIHIKTPDSANISSNFMSGSDENDDDDDDDDVPLYCSTLAKKAEQRNAMRQTNEFINDKNSREKTNVDYELNSQSISHSLEPDHHVHLFDGTNSPQTLTQALESTSEHTLDETQIYHTIMNILEDSGWIQFINSIEDLNMSYDVK